MHFKSTSCEEDTKTLESAQLILLNQNISGEKELRLKQNAKDLFFKGNLQPGSLAVDDLSTDSDRKICRYHDFIKSVTFITVLQNIENKGVVG